MAEKNKETNSLDDLSKLKVDNKEKIVSVARLED